MWKPFAIYNSLIPYHFLKCIPLSILESNSSASLFFGCEQIFINKHQTFTSINLINFSRYWTSNGRKKQAGSCQILESFFLEIFIYSVNKIATSSIGSYWFMLVLLRFHKAKYGYLIIWSKILLDLKSIKHLVNVSYG